MSGDATGALRRLHDVLLICACIVIPLVLVSLMVMLPEWGLVAKGAFSAVPSGLLLAGVIGPGLVPLAFLSWPPGWRWAAAFVMATGLCFLVFAYALGFTCAATGNCL